MASLTTCAITQIVVLLLVASASRATSADLGLRGVSPEARSSYEASLSAGLFSCLDGSGKILSKAVNDNYCDCRDGSDEPGTSACSNGKFYCRNRGFVAKSIPSMFVDDGVCDCCDGSDELSGCNDTCASAGEEMRTDLQKRVKTLEEGLKIKTRLLASKKFDMGQLAHKAGMLQKKVNATTILVSKLEEKLLQEAEELSAQAQAAGDAKRVEDKLKEAVSTGDKSASPDDAAKAGAGGGEAGDGANPPQAKEEESKEETEEEIGRKIASRWTKDPDAAGVVEEDAAATDEQIDGASAGDAEAEAAAGAGGETKAKLVPDPNAKKPEGWDEDEDGKWEAPLIPEADAFDYESFEKESATIISEGRPEDTEEDASFLATMKRGIGMIKGLFKGSEETKLHEEINRQNAELKKMKKELEELEDLGRLDFGEGNCLRPLYNKCLNKRIEKYNYEICLYKHVKQDGLNLGAFQSLGDDRKSFVFDKGAKCWNGPSRSMKVNLTCGTKDDLLVVEEPSMCEYVATLSTPMACEEGDLRAAQQEVVALTGGEIRHDEL